MWIFSGNITIIVFIIIIICRCSTNPTWSRTSSINSSTLNKRNKSVQRRRSSRSALFTGQSIIRLFRSRQVKQLQLLVAKTRNDSEIRVDGAAQRRRHRAERQHKIRRRRVGHFLRGRKRDERNDTVILHATKYRLGIPVGGTVDNDGCDERRREEMDGAKRRAKREIVEDDDGAVVGGGEKLARAAFEADEGELAHRHGFEVREAGDGPAPQRVVAFDDVEGLVAHRGVEEGTRRRDHLEAGLVLTAPHGERVAADKSQGAAGRDGGNGDSRDGSLVRALEGLGRGAGGRDVDDVGRAAANAGDVRRAIDPGNGSHRSGVASDERELIFLEVEDEDAAADVADDEAVFVDRREGEGGDGEARAREVDAEEKSVGALDCGLVGAVLPNLAGERAAGHRHS